MIKRGETKPEFILLLYLSPRRQTASTPLKTDKTENVSRKTLHYRHACSFYQKSNNFIKRSGKTQILEFRIVFSALKIQYQRSSKRYTEYYSIYSNNILVIENTALINLT